MIEMLGRRAVVGGIAAGTAALATQVQAVRRGRRPAPAKTMFDATLERAAQDLLQLAPETATGLGVDTGVNAGLRARLDDGSEGGRAAWKAEVELIRGSLARLDRRAMSPRQRLTADTVDYAAARGQDGARFFYGGGARDGFQGGANPYVLTQQNGATTSVPEFLNSQAPVKTRADAEAYVRRIVALGPKMDQETARVDALAARGVTPPDFILAKTLKQLREFGMTAPAQQPMVLSLGNKLRAAGLAGDWQTRAAEAVRVSVMPALQRQIAAVERSARRAGSNPSVARLPDGAAYYALALKLGTTTDIPAREVHRTGLAQNEEIKARIDTILRAQGMTQGSVGERVVALNSDVRQLFPDTDAGRADLIAYIEERIVRTRALTTRISHLGLKAPVEVRRVPPDIQDGAALGYMNFASLDGARPAIYYVNLKSTRLWPRYQLPTLSAHEAIPGHAWQGAYLAEHHNEVPLITSMMGFNAFVEGWALYSEQQMDEQGLYADDPLGRVGYLQAQQFRACRLVVDTGLHALGWSRDKAIDFLVTQTGKGRDAMTSEVDRYCASPGQACGYKIGHNEIVRLRGVAQTRLGSRFDLAAFNDSLVATGGVPLALLPGVIDRMVAGGGRAV